MDEDRNSCLRLAPFTTECGNCFAVVRRLPVYHESEDGVVQIGGDLLQRLQGTSRNVLDELTAASHRARATGLAFSPRSANSAAAFAFSSSVPVFRRVTIGSRSAASSPLGAGFTGGFSSFG